MADVAFAKRLGPLLGAQFLGAFNDNAFKMLAILVGCAGLSYFEASLFIVAMQISYALPFLLLAGPAGRLSDRFPKRTVVIFGKLAEFAVMLVAALCLAKASSWGLAPLAFSMLLLSAQATFFSPAFNGLLPETFEERELSKANGDIGMASFVAAILGYGAAPVLMHLSGSHPGRCGLILAFLSILGLLASMRAQAGRAPDSLKFAAEGAFAAMLRGWNVIKSSRPLLLSVLGDAFFMGVGAAIQTLIVMTVQYGLDVSGGDMELSALLVSATLGIGFGCMLAGRLSGGKIELGLVPFGAAGMGIFLPLVMLFPGSALAIPAFNTVAHPPLTLWLFLAGVSGGLFVIPLRAYFQQRVEPEHRGAALACDNAICFLSILISGALVFLLSAGSAKSAGALPPAAKAFFSSFPALSPGELFAIAGVLTLLVMAYAMWLLPAFALRFAAVALTHSLYKVRVDGAGRIPERGAALLVSNHVSFVDGLLISCCTSRQVRFLMHEDYYNHPFLNPLARVMGFIEVPSARRLKSMANMFEEVQKALKDGELVCVFPEGRITRNGMLDEFKDGYKRMLPEGLDVPVVPIRLGMIWGSIFSYYYGKIKFRFPKELPHPASVSIGEPAPKGCSSFDLRQLVSKLGADAEMIPRAEERPLHYQVAKNARLHPFRKILIDQSGAGLSSFELLVRSMLLSKEIRRVAGAEPFVGILLPNCSAAGVALVATMMADKVPAPLNFSAGREAMEAAMAKAGIRHVLTSRVFIAKAKLQEGPEMVFLEDLAAGIPKWRRFAAAALAALLPHQELMNLVSPASHRDVFKTAVLLFSSGSSGSPKGVMLSHHNINSDIYSVLRVMGWTRRDRMAGNLPMFHSFGLTTCFWLPIMIGCKVVLIPNPLDAAAIGDAIERNSLTILLATPTFIQSYMRKCRPEQFKGLRLAVVGAEKLRLDIAEKFKAMTGLTLIEGFGCTELSPIVSINVANSILDLGKLPGRRGSVGAPMPGICVKIVDPDSRKELPPDSEGLMMVYGPNVMQGYLNESERSAKAIVDGWYDTGDIAKMDPDGHITICGRLSRFSKIGGEMVPHELVESAINEILKSEERLAAVCGARDPDKGERLLVLHVDMPMSSDEIIAALRGRSLPNLWIPKASNFIKVQSLPLLGSGKLDLVKLRAMAEAISAQSA